MSHVISPVSPKVGRKARLPLRPLLLAGCGCVVAALWAALVLLRVFASGPEDSATACRHAIYRDPVTGREQGIGPARIAADGKATCRGITYPVGAR